MKYPIQEYLHNGKRTYRGVTECIDCGAMFQLETIDEEMFGKCRCFNCFMKANYCFYTKKPR